MARAKYATIVNELHGATSPDSVHRQKRFRDARGRILGYAAPEVYKVTKPRDWERKPALGEELSNQKLWGKACYLYAKALETNEGVDYWQKRFEAQLSTTRGSKPDPFASVLPNGSKKRYIRFDAFVRGIIRNELKAANNHNK